MLMSGLSDRIDFFRLATGMTKNASGCFGELQKSKLRGRFADG
jgi:hypothetical protein